MTPMSLHLNLAPSQTVYFLIEPWINTIFQLQKSMAT
jgi:hypothetical protein